MREKPRERPLVLLADGDEILREMFGRMLRGEGYDVVLVASGEELVSVATTTIPDVISTGLGLKGMPGLRACRRLLADESTTAIPVILFTGHPDFSDEVIPEGFPNIRTVCYKGRRGDGDKETHVRFLAAIVGVNTEQ